MAFCTRLKEERQAKGLSQAALGALCGVSARTIQNYESGASTPQKLEIVQNMARALSTSVDYLLSHAERYVVEAHEKGGARSARDIDALVSEVSGLFAGGTLDDSAIDGAMKALNDAYWQAKARNRKYAASK